MSSIILKPLITEKMTAITEKSGKYGFLVKKDAGKAQIKKAIEDLYEVKISSVATMIYQGKTKSRFTKAGFISGKASAYKKAIVTLADGEKIDFYSSI